MPSKRLTYSYFRFLKVPRVDASCKGEHARPFFRCETKAERKYIIFWSNRSHGGQELQSVPHGQDVHCIVRTWCAESPLSQAKQHPKVLRLPNVCLSGLNQTESESDSWCSPFPGLAKAHSRGRSSSYTRIYPFFSSSTKILLKLAICWRDIHWFASIVAINALETTSRALQAAL